jgi:hypothetical protein
MQRTKITLSLPEDLKKKAQVKAILLGTTLSAVFRDFLVEWVKDWPEGREEKPKT